VRAIQTAVLWLACLYLRRRWHSVPRVQSGRRICRAGTTGVFSGRREKEGLGPIL